jgi:lysophospholipase L1-like esterase
MATKKSDPEVTDQDREEVRALAETPEGLARFRAFMSEVDPWDLQGRTRLQRLLDITRAEANDPTHPNHAEAVRLLADWEVKCRAEN